MEYGFITPNFGYCADARVLADLAHQAEGAGWDGFFIGDHLQFGDVDFCDLVGYIKEYRSSSEPFAVVQFGQTKEAGDTATVGAYAEAGATWWVDAARRTLEGTRERLRKGPPRL